MFICVIAIARLSIVIVFRSSRGLLFGLASFSLILAGLTAISARVLLLGSVLL